MFHSGSESAEEKVSYFKSCANSASVRNFFCGVFMFDVTAIRYLRQQTKDDHLIEMIDLLEGCVFKYVGYKIYFFRERQLLYGYLKIAYKKQLPALAKRLPALTSEPDRCNDIEKVRLILQYTHVF